MDDVMGVVVGFILTIFVFSFVIKDNPLYRLAVHLLVGVSAGYAGVVIVWEVFVPLFERIAQDPSGSFSLLWYFPIFLALLLLLKLFPQTAWLGNSAMAILMAVGAAVGLIGAIVGTLIPQIASSYSGDLTGLTGGLAGLLVGILTICTLVYFHFTGRLTAGGTVVMPLWQRYTGLAGQVVITITLGALFAGAFSTSLILLSERVGFFMNGFGDILTAFVP